MSTTPEYDALNVAFEAWAEIAMAYLGPIDVVLLKEGGLIPHVYVGTGVELTWNGYASAARDPVVTGDVDAINVKFEEWGAIVLGGLADADGVEIEDLFVKIPNAGHTYALPSVQWIWMGWFAGATHLMT